MGKTRKRSIAALILTAILSLFAFVACGKEEKELTLNSESVTVKAGATVTVTATLEGAVSYEWSSDKTDIATVEEGVITGVAQGKCNVTVKAESEGKSYEKTIPVTVTEGDAVSYSVEYYVQQADFTFAADKTETAEAPYGTQVKITPAEKDGYVLDEEKSVLSGKVSKDLVLKVYYAYKNNRIAVTKADGTTSQYYVYVQAAKVFDSKNVEVTDFSAFQLTPDTQSDFYFFDVNGKAYRRSLTKDDFLSFENQTMITERASKDAAFNTVTNTQNIRARNSAYTVDFTDQWGAETAAYIYLLQTVSLSETFYYSAKIKNFADGSDSDISAGFTLADVKDQTKNAQFYIGGDGSNRILTQNNSYAWEAGQSTREVSKDSFAATDGRENLLELFYQNGKFVFYLNGTYLATVNVAEITGKGNQAGLFGSSDELLIGLAQWRYNHSAQFSEVNLLTGSEAQEKFNAVSATLLTDPELCVGDRVVPVIGTPYGNLAENIEWSVNDDEIAEFDGNTLVLKKCGDLEISASLEYLGGRITVSGECVVYATPWNDSRNARLYADNRIETTASGWSGAYAYLASGGADFYVETFVKSVDVTMSVGLTAKSSNGSSVQFYLTYWSVALNCNHAWEANASTKTIFSLERPISNLRLLKSNGVTIAFAHQNGMFRIFYEGFEICSVSDADAYGIQAGDGFAVGVASWNNSVKATFKNYSYTFDAAEVTAKIAASEKTTALANAKYNANGSIETQTGYASDASGNVVPAWEGAYALLDGSGENFYIESTVSSSNTGISAGFTVLGANDANIQIYVTYWSIVINNGFKWEDGASTTVYSIAEGSNLFLEDGFKLGLAHYNGMFHIYYQGLEVYSFADNSAEAYGLQAGDNGYRVGVASWYNANDKALFTDYSATFRADEVSEKVSESVKVSSSFHAALAQDGAIETSIGGWRGAYAVLDGSGENFFIETAFTTVGDAESIGFTVIGGNGVSIQLYFTYNAVALNSGYKWEPGANKTIYTGVSGFNFAQPENTKIALSHKDGVFHLYYNGFELVSFTDADAYGIAAGEKGFQAGVATWNNETNVVRFKDYSVTFADSEIQSKMSAYKKIDTVYRASYKADGTIETLSKADWSGAYAVLDGSGNDFYVESMLSSSDTGSSLGFTVVGENVSIQIYLTYSSVVLNANYTWMEGFSKTIFVGADNVLLLKSSGTVIALSCVDNVFRLYYEGTEIATFSASDAYAITPGASGYKVGVASWNNSVAAVFKNTLVTFDKEEIERKTADYGKISSAVKAVKNGDGSIVTANAEWAAAYYMLEGNGNEFVLETKVSSSSTAISAGFTVVGANGSIQFFISYWNVVLNCNYSWSETTSKTVYTDSAQQMLLGESGSVLRLEYKNGSFTFYCNGTLLVTITAADAFDIQPSESGFGVGVASWFNGTDSAVFTETQCTFATSEA